MNNEKRTEGERLRIAMNGQGSGRRMLATPYNELHQHERDWHEQVAADFAQPYKARIAELEEQVVKLGAWERYEGIVNTRVATLELALAEAREISQRVCSIAEGLARRIQALEAVDNHPQ